MANISLECKKGNTSQRVFQKHPCFSDTTIFFGLNCSSSLKLWTTFLLATMGIDLPQIIPVGTWWGAWSDSPYNHGPHVPCPWLRGPAECLTLTQVCTQITLVHQTDDLSASTSSLILMAFTPGKQILGCISLSKVQYSGLSCDLSYLMVPRRVSYVPFVQLFPV